MGWFWRFGADETAGRVYLEAPTGALVRELLSAGGWTTDELRKPLRRDLTELVEGPAPSFGNSTFTDERWHAMAAGVPYAHAGCLVAYDDQGNAVATVTVWSARRHLQVSRLPAAP